MGAQLLFVNTALLQAPKLWEIADTSRPFVPMRLGGVAAALGFGASTSPRLWLAAHSLSALLLTATLLRYVLLRALRMDSRETGRARAELLIAHRCFAALIVANCSRFGGMPTWLALAVNLGFLGALFWAAPVASGPKGRHEAAAAKGKEEEEEDDRRCALYIAALGFPAFAEAAAIVWFGLPWRLPVLLVTAATIVANLVGTDLLLMLLSVSRARYFAIVAIVYALALAMF